MTGAERPRPSSPAAVAGVDALQRRVATGVFLGGLADAVGAVALASAAVVLAARLFGVVLAPTPVWLALLAPCVAFGAWRVTRRGLDRAAAAEHLDHRLGLESLLASSLEADASAWREPLARGLARSPEALPRIRAGRIAAKGLVPVAALLATAMLPPPAPPFVPTSNPIFREALARFEKTLDLVEKERILEPEPVREVRERVEDLEAKARTGESAPWSDLDAMAERLARAAQEKGDALDRLAEAAAALASGKPGADPTASESDRLAELASAASDAGLVARLDPALAKALGLDRPGARVDPAALAALDAAQRKALAEALAGAASDRLAELARAGLVGGKLGELSKLLAGDPFNDPFRDGDRICSACKGAGGACGTCAGAGRLPGAGGAIGAGTPGRGGVSRGRADAPLGLVGATPEGPDPLAAQRLPQGAPVPDAPSVSTWARSAPDTKPVLDTGAGSAGDDGPGAATWRRRVPPRLRDVVRAWFAPPGEAKDAGTRAPASSSEGGRAAPPTGK